LAHGSWIIVRERWPLSPNIAIIAGLILVVLPISGANGILFTPFVAVWLAVGALLYQRGASPRWIVPFQSACVSISIALAGLYFVGYVSPPWAPPNPGFGPSVVTGVRFVGMGIGPIGAADAGVLLCGVTFLLLASAIIPLRRGLCGIGTPEGSRFFGYVIFVSAIADLVLVMAWDRAGWVPQFGMPDRYSLLSVPALCAAYFAWILYGSETARRRVGIAFAVTALPALPFNIRKGFAWRDGYVIGMSAFEQDLSNGLSWQELGDKHEPFFARGDGPILVERMRMLHEAKIGPLGRAAPS
jgi:hypothetical protein